MFAKANEWDLRPGMVAAEFQWPSGNYCFDVEDVFMVTDGEPVNLMRRRQEIGEQRRVRRRS